jgi:hypothetical protein
MASSWVTLPFAQNGAEDDEETPQSAGPLPGAPDAAQQRGAGERQGPGGNEQWLVSVLQPGVSEQGGQRPWRARLRGWWRAAKASSASRRALRKGTAIPGGPAARCWGFWRGAWRLIPGLFSITRLSAHPTDLCCTLLLGPEAPPTPPAHTRPRLAPSAGRRARAACAALHHPDLRVGDCGPGVGQRAGGGAGGRRRNPEPAAGRPGWGLARAAAPGAPAGSLFLAPMRALRPKHARAGQRSARGRGPRNGAPPSPPPAVEKPSIPRVCRGPPRHVAKSDPELKPCPQASSRRRRRGLRRPC